MKVSAKTIGLVALVVLGAGYWVWSSSKQESETTSAGGPIVDVVVPTTLSAAAQVGKIAYDANCATCHGANGAGQEGVAPPLIHRIYEPGHHGDAAFLMAAKNGVTAHHWPFGNMPPVDGITDQDVASIVAYVREIQRANGIN